MPAPNSQPAPLPLPSSLVPTITPASLQSLAIYNPSLGSTDETLANQLVFYTSRRGSAVTENEKLRQIGLAQGIAEFACGFSATENIWTCVETQKSRVVTLELEAGWWVHAQIELTYIHNPPTFEYSNREVAPAQLLLAQLKKAHAQFCFHYGTLAMNCGRLDRASFCRRVEKHWLRWAWVRWEVMLHGSPVVDLLGEKAVKMAGGRPGKEIERQEHEFMLEWVKKEKARGLVDMVVSRFGEEGLPETPNDASSETTHPELWFWLPLRKSGVSDDSKKSAEGPPPTLMPSDGCIFRGIGAVDVKEVSNYLVEIFERGDDSYGVSSTGVRRKRRKKPNGRSRLGASSGEDSPRRSTSTIRHARKGSNGHSRSNVRQEPMESPLKHLDPAPHGETLESPMVPLDPVPHQEPDEPTESSQGALEDATARLRSLAVANGKILNMLTFGWSNRVQLGRSATPTPPEADDSTAGEEPAEPAETEAAAPPLEEAKRQRGSFLVGFQGDLDLEDIDDDHEDSSGRITSRAVWLSRTQPPPADDCPDPKPTPLEEFKIVVYTNKPFIFAFIFAPSTRSLTRPSFYRSLHHQLSPLISSLLTSASPLSQKPLFDLLLLSSPPTIYTTLPPIPLRDTPGWTRADALHVYTILLGMLQERGERNKEKSSRSMRGWWVNWLKLEGGRGEGLVVRRAGEGKGEMEGMAKLDVAKHLERLVSAAAAAL